MTDHSEKTEVDVSDILNAAGIACKGIIIEQEPGMYPHKKRISDNWSYFTAATFRHLYAEHNASPSSVAIVGIGNGIEGSAAVRAFPSSLKTLYISDVDEGVVAGASRNIRRNLPKRSRVKIEPFIGSFCEPLVERGVRADIVFANIPNLPAAQGADLSGGAEKGTFLRPELYEGYHPPQKYIKWALGAQYAYLMSAKDALTERGSVFTEVGGRVPLALLSELFEETGYRAEEVLVGFKEQTEPLIDFLGYRAFEEEYGVAFDFYKYEPALATLEEFGKGNIIQESGEVCKTALERHRVTAGEAVQLFHRQVAVGHTVHIIKGTKRKL
ncbi:MAG: hypothetical protein Q7R64_04360 [bacterium]|nr:hypothetical protein [bacterium]